MLTKPPKSRCCLEWHLFEKKSVESWYLVLLCYYAEIFEEQLGDLMSKYDAIFRTSKNGRFKFAFLNYLEEQDIDKINCFIKDYHTYVILSLNKNIQQYFTDELDSCLALDYNFVSGEDRVHTEVGELVYNIKYRKKGALVELLSDKLAGAFGRIPGISNCRNICLTYVPAYQDRLFYLPRLATERLVEKVKDVYPLRNMKPLVHAVLRVPKPDFKELKYTQKLREWRKLMTPENISLSSSVRGNPVVVVDDLYQSGTTLWSYAKFLKMIGAKKVMGLVCEKTMRDTHN